VFLSGLLTPPGARDFAHPPKILDEIERMLGRPYRLYPSARYKEGDPDSVLADLGDLLDVRIRTALHLWRRERWDLFFAHLFATDTLQHELWHLLDPQHPKHPVGLSDSVRERVLEPFERIDRELLTPMLRETAAEDTLVILSDHGFGSLLKMIYLNVWLLEEGLLALKPGPAAILKRLLHRWGWTPINIYRVANRLGAGGLKVGLDKGLREFVLSRLFLSFRNVDWSRTRAYAIGNAAGMIFLNLKGREPTGTVEEQDYERVRDEIAARLRAAVDPEGGGPLFDWVRTREEVYPGGRCERAPDLLAVSRDFAYQPFGAADFQSNHVIEDAVGIAGGHRRHGILAVRGPEIAAGLEVEGAGIVDVAPTLLHLAGEPVPTDMDGRVLEEILRAEARRERPPLAGKPLSVQRCGDGEGAYSDDEEAKIEETLRSLGYVE